MSYRFELHPDLNILQKYNYIHANQAELEFAVEQGHGEAVVLKFIPGNITREEFVEKFLDVIETYAHYLLI